MKVQTKRVYDSPYETDGYRVLVDRLWPRGMNKEAARLDHWARAIAPSTELRKWFGHDAGRWKEFQSRYQQELDENAAAFDSLLERLREDADGTITLLYGASNREQNHALMLADLIRARL